MTRFDSMDMTAPHTRRELGLPASAAPADGQPARVVAVTQPLLTVLDDLHGADPTGLSGAEADLLACLIDQRADLIRIHARAREEMGAAAVTILRHGAI